MLTRTLAQECEELLPQTNEQKTRGTNQFTEHTDP